MTMEADHEDLILIVDDNDAARYVKERTLRAAGFRTIEAAYGEQAVALALSERPALILLDIKLPDIDGFEVCRRLREDASTASMAIVQISATFESSEYRVRGLEGGADTYLVAPIEPTVLVATVRSMLRLRRAEARLREFDRRKDEFLATLGHELRNPLAPLVYCLDSLEQQSEGRPQMEASLAIMRRQTEHLIRLVDDLVDISRITQNKLALQLAPVTLAEVVEIAIEARHSEVKAKNQTLAVSLPDTPVELYADSVRLTQVLGNLISNSSKYTPPGGDIRIEAEVEGDVVALSVVDNGAGISHEDLERIFDLFVQVRQRGAGLGIGLALVSRIVEMHGGTVTAQSEGLHRGSRFTVRLPISTRSKTDASAQQNDEEAGTDSRRKVLIVDDNVDAVDAMAELLQAMNHDVRTCYGGVDGLAVAGEFQPEVIFMDISMPDMSGLESVERIRRQPWSKDTLICILSGHGQANDRARSAAVGVDVHLVKPVGREVLIEMLRRTRSDEVPRKSGNS